MGVEWVVGEGEGEGVVGGFGGGEWVREGRVGRRKGKGEGRTMGWRRRRRGSTRYTHRCCLRR